MIPALLLLACGDAEHTGETGVCADAPALSWDNFGDGFMTQHCQPCHHSGSPDRQGAPEQVTFDTQAQTLALRERVLVRAADEAGGMPPQGGVDPVDRELLALWLSCAP